MIIHTVSIASQSEAGKQICLNGPEYIGTPSEGGLLSHWWTEWAPAWGYIPATGAGEEDTL